MVSQPRIVILGPQLFFNIEVVVVFVVREIMIDLMLVVVAVAATCLVRQRRERGEEKVMLSVCCCCCLSRLSSSPSMSSQARLLMKGRNRKDNLEITLQDAIGESFELCEVLVALGRWL
ncbi:hypothetical protein ACFX14_014899 [Malus domestica]